MSGSQLSSSRVNGFLVFELPHSDLLGKQLKLLFKMSSVRCGFLNNRLFQPASLSCSLTTSELRYLKSIQLYCIAIVSWSLSCLTSDLLWTVDLVACVVLLAYPVRPVAAIRAINLSRAGAIASLSETLNSANKYYNISCDQHDSIQYVSLCPCISY